MSLASACVMSQGKVGRGGMSLNRKYFILEPLMEGAALSLIIAEIIVPYPRKGVTFAWNLLTAKPVLRQPVCVSPGGVAPDDKKSF